MNHLNDYTEKPLNELFDRYGAFYAFSNDQFREKAIKAIKYCKVGMGLILPKIHFKDFQNEYLEIIKECIQKDINENGLDNIIERELANYECYYTYNYNEINFLDALKDYPITKDDIKRVFHATYDKHAENF